MKLENGSTTELILNSNELQNEVTDLDEGYLYLKLFIFFEFRIYVLKTVVSSYFLQFRHHQINHAFHKHDN
jgi:hypothetical protein